MRANVAVMSALSRTSKKAPPVSMAMRSRSRLGRSARALQAQVRIGALGVLARDDVLRQLGEADRVAAGEDHGALHHVLELADVSRPAVGDQALERVVADAAHRLAERRAELRDEVVEEQRDLSLLARLSERAIRTLARPAHR